MRTLYFGQHRLILARLLLWTPSSPELVKLICPLNARSVVDHRCDEWKDPPLSAWLVFLNWEFLNRLVKAEPSCIFLPGLSLYFSMVSTPPNWCIEFHLFR